MCSMLLKNRDETKEESNGSEPFECQKTRSPCSDGGVRLGISKQEEEGALGVH